MKIAIVLFNSSECELDRKTFIVEDEDANVQDEVSSCMEIWSVNIGDIIKIIAVS